MVCQEADSITTPVMGQETAKRAVCREGQSSVISRIAVFHSLQALHTT